MQYVAPQETYNLLSSTTFSIFSILATIICGIAVISNYAFPAQRKFPNIVLVWTCIMDLILALYTTVKWTDGPLKSAINVNIKPGSFACRASIYTILVLEMGSAITCVVVAFTLYSTVVKNVDFENFGTLYYKKILALIWGVTFLVPLISLFDIFVPDDGAKVCSLTSALGFIVFFVPWGVLFIIQVSRQYRFNTQLTFFSSFLFLFFPFPFFSLKLRYILHVVIYIIRTTYRVRSLGTSSSAYTWAQLWLYTRFISMTFSQCVLWLNVNIWNIKNMRNIPITRVHLNLISLIPFFLSINGLIVLLGNKSLKDLIWKKVNLLAAKLQILSHSKNKALPEIVLSESQDSPL